MKKITFLKYLLFLIAFSALGFVSKASTLYWVGDAGSWTDSNHWSANSGGKGGAGVPGMNDDVIFDMNSFHNPGETVIISAGAKCHNMTWTSGVYSPVVAGNSSSTLEIYGSFQLAYYVTWSYNGSLYFKSSANGNTIVTNGKILTCNVYFDGTGSWQLNSSFTVSSPSLLTLNSGTLHANGNNIVCNTLAIKGSGTKLLDINSSSIFIKNQVDSLTASNFTCTAVNGNIYYKNYSGVNNFTALTNTLSPPNIMAITFTDTTVKRPSCNCSDTGFTIGLSHCCDGKIVIKGVNGGGGPADTNFKYNWTTLGIIHNTGHSSDSVSGVCASVGNSINLLLTDKTTLTNRTITINNWDPAAFGVTESSFPTTCSGDCNASIVVSWTGETPNYTYVWTNAGSPKSGTIGSNVNLTESNLCTPINPTNDTVLITDKHGCQQQYIFGIIQTPPLTVTITSTPITCDTSCNGTATATASGGNLNNAGKYTYKWSPGGQTTTTITSLCEGTYTCTVTDDSGCVGKATVVITEPPPLTMTVTSQTNEPCFGNSSGSACVTVGGGTPAYTYTWSNGQTTSCANALSAGTYKLVVKDAHNCKDSINVTITQPPVLTATITSFTNVKCAGGTGTITVTAGGGTPAYSYSWAPSGGSSSTVTVTAGCYTVTVTDANGCSVTASQCITQPAPIKDSIIKIVNVKCNNKSTGSAKDSVWGGTAPYSYSWSTIPAQTNQTATGLGAGTYTITVTDKNGCTGTASVTITQPPLLTANITSQVNVDCKGNNTGSATVTAGGGTPAYTYAWTPGGQTGTTATGLSAGCYTVTVTDANGCTATASCCITQPANPLTVSLSSAPPISCFGQKTVTISTAVSGGTAAYSYSWAPGGQTSASITGQGAGSYTVTVTDAHGCTATASITVVQPPQLRDSITSVTNLKCFNTSTGKATVGVKGGTPGYSYTWSPSGGNGATASNLSAGTYTVTVTDKNGCTATASVTITSPPALSLAMGFSGEKCNGDKNGEAWVTVSGGTPGYTYTWAPSGGTLDTAKNLAIGCYTVTVKDANNCTATASVCITQPPPLTAVISSTKSSCKKCDGSATVTAGGGTIPYTYKWSNGQTQANDTALCPGNYTITVTDANGCTATAKVTIVQTVSILITTSGSTVSCDSSCDGIASANPSGGASPYTYSWAPGGQTGQNATGLCAGSYTVTVTDVNGCNSVDSVVIGNPPKLKLTTSQTNVSCASFCNGTASVTASGGTPGYTYKWSTGATTTSITNLCVGTYTIMVTDNNGCKDSAVVNITVGGSMSDNPTTTPPTCGSSNGSITLAPSGGSPPYTYSWNTGATTATITGLSAGTYTVTITDNAGCSQTFFVPLSNISGPTLTASNTKATCADTCDGTATVTVTAGVAPFTYLWSNGATTSSINGLCPGVYTCNVKDNNGCVTVITDTIKKPIPIDPHAVVQNIICASSGNTGKITLSPTGGTAPYTYSWAPNVSTTNSATGLSAGTYTIEVKDNVACDTVIMVTITEPPVLNVVIGAVNNVTCFGFKDGSTTAATSGGTPPYIYNWSNGEVTPTDVNLGPGTYTVTVTDANGCTGTASVTITEPAPLSDVMTVTNVSCNLFSDGQAVATVSGGTSPYTYSWSNGQTTNTLSGVGAGTYYLTVTDAHGCTLTDSAKITQPPPITITFTSQNVVCNGDCNGTATATPAGGTPPYTYSWNTIPSQTTQKATGLCAGTYIVTVTDANGCTANNNVTITQPTPLVANPSATVTTCSAACNGTASSSPTGGTPPYTYKWSNGQTTSTITSLCPGLDTVVVTDKNGCVDTGIINVPKPTPFSISASTSPSNCLASNGSITVSASGGNPAYTYSWAPGGQTTSTITGLAAGIYTVTVTDSKGCDSSFAIILNNTGGPSSFTNSVNNELCFGDAVGNIDAIPNGGSTPYTYFWTNLPAPSGQGTDSIFNLAAGTYTLEVTDNAGCIQFDTVTVTQPPTINITGVVSNATCLGVCTGTITTTVTGGTPAYTYLWTPGGQTTAKADSLCPGNDTLTVTDANGCKSQKIFTVGASTAITVTTSVLTNNLCNSATNGSAKATAVGGGGTYTYSWMPGAQTNQTATNLTTGTYTITVTDQNGCQGTATASITAPPAITLTLKVAPITCNGSKDGQIIAIISGGVGPYKNHWSPGGSKSDTLTGLGPGTYIDTVSDANGCVAIDSVKLIDPPVFTETHTVSNASCNTTPDGSITLTVTGGITPYTYSWSPAVSTGSTASNISAGTYTVTIKDSTGCTIIDSISLPADTTVLAEAGNDTGICVGSATITLNGSGSNINSKTFQWFQLPGMVPIGNTAIITIPAPGTTTTYILVTADGTCTDADSVTITINPLPVVDAGPTKTIFIYFSTTIGGSPTGPSGSTYHWQPANGLSDTTAPNPTASPTVTTTYTVTVTNANGCSASDTVTVFVLPQIQIPSGFTPNSDGQNDVWNIKNIDQFPNAVVELFNRWGEELFKSTGYKTPWDGTYDGKPLPVGTYYYIIDLHDPRFPKAYTGPVTIMR